MCAKGVPTTVDSSQMEPLRGIDPGKQLSAIHPTIVMARWPSHQRPPWHRKTLIGVGVAVASIRTTGDESEFSPSAARLSPRCTIKSNFPPSLAAGTAPSVRSREQLTASCVRAQRAWL